LTEQLRHQRMADAVVRVLGSTPMVSMIATGSVQSEVAQIVRAIR